MSTKILIGYDGSEFANHAISDLPLAGLPADAEAVVLTAADVWPQVLEGKDPRQQPEPGTPLSRSARSLAVVAMNEAESVARQGAARVCELFPKWEVTSEASPNPPARALVDRADAWLPSLLVVGGHGRSAVAQLVAQVFRSVGSVAQKVVRFAPCSVRIGRQTVHAPVIRPVKLIVGVDGSTESASAVQAVAIRKWPAGSEVKVITVLAPCSLGGLSQVVGDSVVTQSDLDARIAQARRSVDRCAAELRESGLAAIPLVLEGNPKYVLMHEAEQWRADCIFVGAHGMGRIERFLLGSVSGAVAERAHCSVEVVRHPASAT